MIPRLLISAFAAILLASSALAQTVINSVPFAINVSGKYVLGNNLVVANGFQSCITVNAPNVILDLNGFFVSGPGNVTSSTASAIFVNAVSNVTIRNGTVANQGYGITFVNDPGNSLNHLVENVNATRCYLAGIRIGAAFGSIIRNNAFTQIGGYTGIANSDATGISSAAGVRIEGNNIAVVTPAGTGTSYGINGPGSICIGNVIFLCEVGISGGSSTKCLNNLTSSCTTPFSGITNVGGNN